MFFPIVGNLVPTGLAWLFRRSNNLPQSSSASEVTAGALIFDLHPTGMPEAILSLPVSAFSGSPPLFGVVDCFGRVSRGDGLMKRNVFALFGAVTVLLTTMTAMTLSRATFASGIGGLKCYDVKGGIEKCSVVDQPPFIGRTSVRHSRLD